MLFLIKSYYLDFLKNSILFHFLNSSFFPFLGLTPERKKNRARNQNVLLALGLVIKKK